jgi:flagellar hook-associated protein 3 FlgL
MISFLDASTQSFLSGLRDTNSRLLVAQRQVSSGKRLVNPSDAPDDVATLLESRSALSRLDQIGSNMSRLKTEADGSEDALQQAVTLFDRVRTLAEQGTNMEQTADTRKTIADEVGSILQRFVGLSNTQIDGRSLFAGDSDQTFAYNLDYSQTPPWGTYNGSPATRQAIHPNGTSFDVSKTASEIFDNSDPAKNVFQAIENVRQALLNNDDTALQNAIAPLSGVSAHVNSMLGFYGTVQNQITDANNSLSKMKLQLQTEKATLEDADPTESIVSVQQLQYQQQVALEVRGKTPRTSLFDYLG